jgi:PAS domain-containing protein
MRSTRPATPKPPRDAAAPVDAVSRARLFASVMANAKDAVLVTEAEPVDLGSGGPRIVYVNEAFTTATGYTSADAVGHDVGDQVLTTVAGRLSALVRPGDTAARFGGTRSAASSARPSSSRSPRNPA